MKNIFLLTVSLFVGLLSMAQPQIIVNTITKEHQTVAGTKISLIPPVGFVKAKGFSGFEKKTVGASIMIISMPAPFTEIETSFSAEALAQRGLLLVKKENIRFQSMDGLLLEIVQNTEMGEFSKYLLMFGTEEHTHFVNVMCPMEDTETMAEMKKALFTTIYDETGESNPLTAAHFSIDYEAVNLKFAYEMAGMLMFSKDGKVPTLAEDKAAFMVGSSMAAIEKVSDKKQYVVESLGKMPTMDYAEIKEVNAVTINGLSGYEIVAYRKDKTEFTVQTILFKEETETTENYYLLLGIATQNFEENLALFRKATNSFRLK